MTTGWSLIILHNRTVHKLQHLYQVWYGMVWHVGGQGPRQGSPSSQVDAEGGDQDKAGNAKNQEQDLGGEEASEAPTEEAAQQTSIIFRLGAGRSGLFHRVVVVVVTLGAGAGAHGVSSWGAVGVLDRGCGRAVGVRSADRRACRGAVGVFLRRSSRGAIGIRSSSRGAIGIRSSSSRSCRRPVVVLPWSDVGRGDIGRSHSRLVGGGGSYEQDQGQGSSHFDESLKMEE